MPGAETRAQWPPHNFTRWDRKELSCVKHILQANGYRYFCWVISTQQTQLPRKQPILSEPVSCASGKVKVLWKLGTSLAADRIMSPLEENSPSLRGIYDLPWPGYCSNFTATPYPNLLVFLLILKHVREAAASGPLHVPLPLLGTQISTRLPPSLSSGRC